MPIRVFVESAILKYYSTVSKILMRFAQSAGIL